MTHGQTMPEANHSFPGVAAEQTRSSGTPALAIKGWLGDDLVTNDSTANLTFNVQQVVAQASRFMTLEPGDIIHFGMAAVPAMPEKYPTTWNLDMSRLGGPVAVEIEGIGTLRNPVEIQHEQRRGGLAKLDSVISGFSA